MNHEHGRAALRHCMVVFATYPVGETRVQRQAEALIQSGIEVDILCLRDPTDPRCSSPVEVVNGAQVRRLPVARSDGRATLLRQFGEYLTFFGLVMLTLFWLHPRRRYRVVQVHNLPDFLVFAAWFPKLLGARLLLDLHDLMPEFFAARTGTTTTGLLVRLVTLQEQLACAFADHVITATEVWREKLIRRGLPAHKVSVVMNVADERIFRRCAGDRAARAAGGFQIVYHGAIPPRYGLDLVLEAIAELSGELHDLQFTVYSWDNHHIERLRRRAESLGIEDRVKFHKALPAEALPGVLSLADVGVIPNLQDEFTDWLLPTKLMEYVALGIPVIAARTPGITRYFDDTMLEFFTPGQAGSLAAAIKRLYFDRERGRYNAQQADRFNERHNWRAEGASYVALVARLGLPPARSRYPRERRESVQP